jgi:hypothetical protein
MVIPRLYRLENVSLQCLARRAMTIANHAVKATHLFHLYEHMSEAAYNQGSLSHNAAVFRTTLRFRSDLIA